MKPTLSALALLAAVGTAAAQKVTVTGGAKDSTNVVVFAPLPGAAANTVTLPDGTHTAAQPDRGKLVFVLPKVKAGESLTLTPTMLNYVKAPPHFRFPDVPGKQTDLLFGDRLVTRFVDAKRDGTSKESHFLTFKPFHHVYDPATGKVELTSGALPQAKENLYPHHRGLFFGFNKITYGDKKTADIWHGTNNVYSQADGSLSTAGEVFGRLRAFVSWHGPDGQKFAGEEREVTAYNVPGGTLIDWSTTLKTELPKVRLDGDPQHSGFHFRAAQEVAKNGKTNTYYLRPDGKGKVGETRNWEPKTRDPKTVNLPWNAVSFVVAGKRYTVLRLNHPLNPGETRGSERDYGRFGDYFEYDLTPDKPLKLTYRVWVQEGEMTVEQCEAMSRAFVSPPEVKVSK
jgi:hypothetical protein